ncbi:Lambda Phage CIII [Cedecea lapagei]|uniref:Lambda Phage CIII n=1 Tax=Cedecea lapagei TaxID=158823 RepID=A0A3S4IN00_9ENTR|nr:protease FtsH-inhibitory lysogeny factor CIII [Cedecea lapagei]VEB97376.1 Lambda Phage CIII [Cedecea lapagei]VEC00245.1 Lambda Phage CIII [Cedecea lapagei]
MIYQFAGSVAVGAIQQNESQLERLTRQLRNIGKWLKDTLNQRGEP